MSPNHPTPPTAAQPPEEQFWRRYSPHGEAPLSGAGSVTLHALIFGSLLLWVLYILPTFAGSKDNIRVEAVRLDKGGGGGPAGPAERPGGGAPREAAEVKGPDELIVPPSPDIPPPPDRPPERDLEFPDNVRPLNIPSLKELAERARVPFPGPAGEKGGVPGRGGTGDGPGPGTGGVQQNRRERQMNRWVLRFDTSSGADYVGQLRGLGAILAVPTRESREDPGYRLIRDLRPGAELLDEDLSRLNRIYWRDEKPESVREVMDYLGLRMSPSHFVAFMPLELEQRLYELEARYLKRHHPRATEDDIDRTHFRVVRTGKRHVPELVGMKMRP